MKLAFPAYWTEGIPGKGPLQADKVRMKRAGDVLGWGLRSETDSVIEFEVYTNWKSWGEEVIVSFGPGVIAIRLGFSRERGQSMIMSSLLTNSCGTAVITLYLTDPLLKATSLPSTESSDFC